MPHRAHGNAIPYLTVRLHVCHRAHQPVWLPYARSSVHPLTHPEAPFFLPFASPFFPEAAAASEWSDVGKSSRTVYASTYDMELNLARGQVG